MGWSVRGGVAALSLLSLPGCILGHDRCDAHQVKLKEGNYELCVCEANAVPNPVGYGCTPCGANEEPKDGVCVCKEGFAKVGEGGSCELSEIGKSCSSEASCPSTFPYCASEAGGGGGYCTQQDCGANADCPQGWSCEQGEAARYCRKAPSGLGSACKSSADCAGFEASYCDTLQTHSCILAGCAEGTSTCPSEWGCCDYSKLLGSAFSVCVQPEVIAGGSCPQGGSLVKP